MIKKNKKILIAGGVGFIGVNLVEYLLESTGWQINVLDNLSAGSQENLKKIRGFPLKRVHFKKGDIRNKKDISKIIKQCDFVVNLAAKTGVIPAQKNPRETAEVNILGLINLLEASRDNKIKRFVHMSSGAALGNQQVPLNEKKIPRPLSIYGASKLAGEGYCSAYSKSFGLENIVLRLPSVYGSYSFHKESIVHKIIKQILKGEAVNIYGNGGQTRDFLYAKDACQAIFLSLIKKIPEDFEIFQIGTGRETSINSLLELIRKEFKKIGYKIENPVYKPARAGEIKRNYADIGKAKKILNVYPKAALKEGVKKTVENYISYKI